MALTASFSEVRQNLTYITDRVARENVEVTVFKRSKPVFRIVPVAVEDGRSSGVQDDGYTDWRAASATPEQQDDRAQLFEEAMALRERASVSEGMSALASMSVEDMKRELADRV